MRVLVTGGAGFIGSNLVDRLIDDGHDVLVIDNESSDAHDNFYWNDAAQNFVLDVHDYELSRPLYDDVEVVFHLAAQARIQPAIEGPIDAVRSNCLGTATALQCAHEAGVGRFVFASSSSIYGRTVPPNHEAEPSDCLNHYSASKRFGEQLCSVYWKLHGLQTVALRYFNVYGPRQPLRGQYAPVVGLFMRQHRNGEPLTIVGDGEQRRDFTHVDDVVQANLLAGFGRIRSRYLGKPMNVGTGRNHSVNEVARMIGDEYGVVNLDERPGEARVTLANIGVASEVLDWRPRLRLENWIAEQRS